MWASMDTGVSDYNNLVRTVLGDKSYRWFTCVTVSTLYGALVTYNVLISIFVPLVLKDLGVPETFIDPAPYARELQMAIVCGLVMPMFMLKDLSSLGFMGFIGFLIITYTSMILLIETPIYKNHYYDPETFLYGRFTIKSTQAIAITLFSFSNHFAIFPVLKSELHNPTKKRMKKIFFRETLICWLFYTLVGATGYISLNQATPHVIIERERITEQDYFMLIARTFFPIYLSISLPMIGLQLK